MAVAQTIADSLLGQLNQYSTENTQPDPFTTVRLRREVDKLRKVDLIGALLCDAILYTLEGDYDHVVENFTEIFTYTPEDPDMHENYGNSLVRLNRLSEAHDAYVKALEYSHEPTSIFLELAKTSMINFRTQEYVELLSDFGSKADLERVTTDEIVEELLRLNAKLQHFDVDPSDAAEIFKVAERVCIRYGKEIPSGSLRHTALHGGAKITFYGEVACGPDEIADMNFAICDELVEADLCEILDQVSYVFVPASDSSGMDSQYADH